MGLNLVYEIAICKETRIRIRIAILVTIDKKLLGHQSNLGL